MYGQLYCADINCYEHRKINIIYLHAMSNMQIRFIPTFCTVYTLCKVIQHVLASIRRHLQGVHIRVKVFISKLITLCLYEIENV